MKLKAQLVKRGIAGDTILVPVGETTTAKLQGLLTINEVRRRHMGCAAGGGGNEEAIVERLYEMFDVERDVLRQDVHAFVAKLRELDIL
ncbi:MAG: PqqD family protein [Oscillospiraceae bacterium]